MKSNRGFTLIELLVVISIIGVLSSIVLAGLQASRVKSVNARIMQEVQQLRNQIELSRSGDNFPSLSRSGPSGPGGIPSLRVAMHTALSTGQLTLVTDILKQNGKIYPSGYGGSFSNAVCGIAYDLESATNSLVIFVNNDLACLTPVSKYAIYAAFGPTVGSSGYFCIDSAGRNTKNTTGGIPTNPTVSTTCQ